MIHGCTSSQKTEQRGKKGVPEQKEQCRSGDLDGRGTLRRKKTKIRETLQQSHKTGSFIAPPHRDGAGKESFGGRETTNWLEVEGKGHHAIVMEGMGSDEGGEPGQPTWGRGQGHPTFPVNAEPLCEKVGREGEIH